MVWSIKLDWHGREVHVAEGFASQEEAREEADRFRRQWNMRDNPFRFVQESSGDTAEQADANPSDLDDDDDDNDGRL